MTNEEKAREFLSHIIAEFNDNPRNRENIVKLGKLFEVCFLSACEWKDQQFKEYLDALEKRADSIYRKAVTTGDTDYNIGKAYGELALVVEIINKLFGEEQQ